MRAPILTLLATALSATAFGQPFRIHVQDAETGRGVPLVELKLTNSHVFLTDNAGMVAFDEPGLMNTRVHFTVSSHGYTYKKDGFQIPGIALDISPGGSAVLKVDRVNVAERLYRITGAGLYRDSILLGDTPPIEQPLINGLVMGQDSVQSIIYRDRIHWIWGDTGRPAYPLGNFEASGAESDLPGQGGLDPSLGINLRYFVDKEGFSRPMLPIEGPGPVWLDGLMIIPDSDGTEQLYCHWIRVKSLGEIYERGLARYNDETDHYEPIASLPVDSEIRPYGHPVELTTQRGREYFFGAPFANLRVAADVEAIKEAGNYLAFTPLTADGSAVERDDDGHVVYGWKPGAPYLGGMELLQWRNRGELPQREWPVDLRDIETGKDVVPHGGSLAWNPYRNKWVAIVLQTFGEPSFLGEIWYAEADTPLGPWVWARRIVTHNKYSFYNPKHHPFFDQDGGRVIYFEGTYTAMFSGNEHLTPRYDYNQIMYRLSLDDPRVHLPAPVYRMESGELTLKVSADEAHGIDELAFFAIAPEDAREGHVAVYASGADGEELSTQPQRAGQSPLFYALALNEPENAATVELPGIGRVWPNRTDPAVIRAIVRDGTPLSTSQR